MTQSTSQVLGPVVLTKVQVLTLEGLEVSILPKDQWLLEAEQEFQSSST